MLGLRPDVLRHDLLPQREVLAPMGLFETRGMWRGILCAPLTPFNSDLLSVNEPLFGEQIEYLVKIGVPALAPGLHAGESPSMSTAERDRLLRLTVEAARGRVPVVAHVTSSSTLQAIEHARAAAAAGADAVVAASPYYWKPTDAALVDHFTAIANAVDIQLIPYVYPGDLSLEHFGVLLESVPSAAGIKSGDFDLQYLTELCRIVAARRPDFSVFAGTEYALPMAVIGGAGSFSAVGLVAPRLIAALSTAVDEGNHAAALPLQHRVSQLWHLLKGGYPARIKAAAAIMGRDFGPARPPVRTLAPTEIAELETQLAELGLTESEGFGWSV